jgi:hypothetical protein
MLPKVDPDFRTLTDIDLVGLIAYCEKWAPKTVYNTAFSQVFPKRQLEEVKQPFIEWIDISEPKLPPIVREELVRAARINFESGKMNKLKFYAQFRELISLTVRKWGFWIFILLITWYWL